MRRYRVRWVRIGLAVAMLGTAGAWLAVNEGHLEDARAALATSKAQLQRTQLHLFLTRRANGAASSELAQQRSSLQQTDGQLWTDGLSLNNTSNSVALQGLDFSTLHACLSGVTGAYSQVAAHNEQGAVTALSGSSAACLQTEGAGSSGLVYPFDFPDPFVLLVGNTYYAYATNSASGKIQVATSTDLAHWTPAGDALGGVPSWAAPGGVWAPSVLELNGTFVMYYSTVFGSSGEQCISVATASSPAGPFADASPAPLQCQLSLGGSIDPSVFVDPVSGLYLYWKSQGTNSQPPTIWGQPLDGTGVHFTGDPIPLFTWTQAWEHGTVEAPDMFWLNGQRYLFYSGSDWRTDSYATGVAACAGPLGPCTKPLDRPILSSQPGLAGPGGATAFTDVNGQPWLAFAAWLPGQINYPNSRVLFVRPLRTAFGVPTVCATVSC